MPVLTKDNILDATGVAEITWMRSEFQIVRSIALIDLEHAYDPTDAFAEIGIMSGGRTLAHRVAPLATGYVGSFSPVIWDGSMPTELDSFIYALVIGTAGHKFRLAATVWKIVTAQDSTFRVDP